MTTDRRIPPRALLLAPGGFALLAGLDAALVLLGLPAPTITTRLAEVHGILLVLGFVGTVVALERAVAAHRGWAYLSPMFLGAGAVLLAIPAPRNLGGVLLLAGSAMLVAVYVSLWRRSADVAVLVQVAGAVLATGAVLLWLGRVPIPDLLPWLSGFLILTIVGERLELARVAMLGTRAEALLTVVAVAMVAGTVAALLWPVAGYPLLGGALLAAVVWLGRFDVARHTVRATGLTRYMAVCLIAGYGWLLVPALTWLLVGQVRFGTGYDAVVHAVMLGFVLSIIMAHAPVILPAVLRRPLPYTCLMYGPVALLHLSLLLRLAVGDARGVQWAVQAGGVLNIVAVLGFIAVAGYSATRAANRVPA
ncbi:hypothetical protein BN971_04506 [Mycobacterium bohemicum DSM 44277]|uniref:Uncharacterized protein n=2 Tax=Mycobacterium bohemicum TaxID=56425 RepID=A0A1X1R5G4_MYCBE|nr:hypothetical protein [Mycobacterium bohemicum]MCV6969345.1 hypothetical protein [Mycobacterium bohemicum]ORU99975.1 hypothetical protein AWB93_09505 [Mycobacterium bohemicum]CPR13199.1 hypothetical protein BN971_04506 [Mycobacterium bohemicum DSM 44277]